MFSNASAGTSEGSGWLTRSMCDQYVVAGGVALLPLTTDWRSAVIGIDWWGRIPGFQSFFLFWCHNWFVEKCGCLRRSVSESSSQKLIAQTGPFDENVSQKLHVHDKPERLNRMMCVSEINWLNKFQRVRSGPMELINLKCVGAALVPLVAGKIAIFNRVK